LQSKEGALRLLFAISFALPAIACGPVPLEPRDPDPGVPHFVLQTYNLRDEISGDPATTEAVGAGGADVICLQEVTSVWEGAIRNRYTDEYPYMLFHPLDGAEGLGFLSRYPLKDLGFLEEAHGWHPAWHVQAETVMGAVQLLNVHLRSMFTGRSNVVTAYVSTSDDHLEELQAFTAACDVELPTLVLGDFNEQPDGESLKFLEDRGFQNALPLYHPGQATWHDPPAWQMEQTIDHILFDRSFIPLNSWVEDIGNSDHLPVLLHVEAAPTPSPGISSSRR
jgi:endonuclease/exonuclease/phosphatase family metal-dependent hydrolase